MRLQKGKWTNVVRVAIVAMLAVSLLAGCGTSSAPGNQTTPPNGDKTINIGYVNWAEDVAVSYL